jgi:CRISPR-associated protein Cmr6
MPLLVPLPKSLRDHRDACTHPGLLLDKFVKSFDPSGQETGKWQEAVQKSTAEDVVKRSQQPPVGLDFEHLVQRWQNTLRGMNAVTFRCTTTSPLTLHLSRASALENAGICLHPLYGFAYLPGSGLKGMARAYAETIWLPAQPDPKQAWRQIEDVFGWAPNPDRKEQIKDPKHPAEVRRQDDTDPESPEIKASSGNIVFHDAWPESWPKLIVDIVNNHHPDYYQHDDNNHAPGDWENPVPVYFLAVKPGVTFAFPLAKRRADVADGLLDLARQWLLGALCHLGAGAKTNAGYGAFKHAGDVPPATVSAVAETWKQTTESSKHRAECSTTLELVTPAFLAGANQQAEDCDLRPATLRGLLRWWWRTMHAGYVDVKTLRALEAAIWGDTKSGGAVRIVLETDESHGKKPGKVLYSHPQNRGSGTRYVAYGMDETSKGQRRQRYRLEPPASWKLRLVARPTTWNNQKIPSGHILEQAKAALWLLCHFGGVGSKSRKGFGSLAAKELGIADLDACRKVGCKLREVLSLNSRFAVDQAESPSISDPDLRYVDINVKSSNTEEVIERIGLTCSKIASRFKHNVDQEKVIESPNKAAWGLPRKIHGPRDDGPLRRKDGTYIQKPEDWLRPEWLDFPKRPRDLQPRNARHASPIHIHVAGSASGEFVVRLLAMPARYLPDRSKNVEMLEVFSVAFEQEILALSKQQHSPPSEQTAQLGVSAHPSNSAADPTPVRVKFLRPHDKLKDAFWVQEEGKKRGLLKYGTPPNKRTPPEPLPAADSEIEVYRTNDNPNSPEYRWDKPEPPRDQPRGKRPPRGGRR